MRRKKNRHAINFKSPGVNMTSMMDLTFVLLILFVITVPILDYTTDVTPPKLTTSKQIPEEDHEAIKISMDKDGNCSIDGIPCPVRDLEKRLRAEVQSGKTRVRIRASGERPYEEVVALIRPASHCGLEVQLETQGE